ncbi:hypothetical protein CLF_106321 [Clonorchis sinensis]|uniref:Uncharacterized protein n=1 Tax=Clonorchis sinensis TaxID=79923 RepID=G7YEY6_CLOSI|nr:hypothetical protein CLF_106321 [Clonorchis sinensis]
MPQLLHTQLASCSHHPQLGTKRRLHTFDELVGKQLVARYSVQSRSNYCCRLAKNTVGSHPARRRYNQSITVERFPGNPQLPNVSISDDEREILNLERSRIHYTSRRYSGSALEVQLYGRPGDAFLVRMSIRESPTHTFTGYPELSDSQIHSVCLVDGTSDTLKIRWAAALSDDMQPQYCVSINAEENLYYQCTAYARLNATILRQYGTIDRPASFGKTEQLRPRTINNFVYTCLPNKTLQVRLPPALALSLSRLGKDTSAKLFINVYAVNTRVSLSTAYAVRVLDRPVERCGSVRPVDVMKVHSLPSFHKIRWATDIEFELPAGVRQFEAFYQTCKVPGDFTAKSISVQLYHIREKKEVTNVDEFACNGLITSVPSQCFTSTGSSTKLAVLCKVGYTRKSVSWHTEHVEQKAQPMEYDLFICRGTPGTAQRIEVCRQPIIDSRIHAVCTQNHTGGYYLLQVKEPAGINHGQESGRFYLRQPNTYEGILRPANTEFSTRITRVLTNSTSEPYLKSPDSITVKPFYVISAASSRWRENNLSHMVMRGYRNVGNVLRLHRRRRRSLLRHASHIPSFSTSTTSYQDGLGVGIDCQGPQVYARLRIHASSQYYWIYTTPIPFWMMKRRREWLFARLNNMTDHCAYPSAYYSVITNNTWRGMKCLSAEGQEELRFLIPAYDHVNDPPYHLITIYIAHRKDLHGERKELLTQELFDACRLHASNCYRNKTDSPCALRSYGMSDDPKYTYRLIRTQHQCCTYVFTDIRSCTTMMVLYVSGESGVHSDDKLQKAEHEPNTNDTNECLACFRAWTFRIQNESN